jgi:hypothetical protein
MRTMTTKTVAASPVATKAERPMALGLVHPCDPRGVSAGPLPMSEIRRMRADLVLGTRTEADQRAAAFAVDCGRLSGLALIADLEGFDAVVACRK